AHPRTRQVRHFNRRPSGAVAAEHAPIDLVHPRKLLDVDEEDAAAQHVGEAGSRCLEDVGDVLQHLFRLCFDVGTRELVRRRVASSLTGDEHQIADDGGRRIGARGGRQPAAGHQLHLIAHAAILCEEDAPAPDQPAPGRPMTLLNTAILMLATALGAALVTPPGPQGDSVRDALNLGRTHDQALYDAFNAGYRLTPSGIVDSVEVITEFRRAVLIVREHALQGEYSFTAN